MFFRLSGLGSQVASLASASYAAHMVYARICFLLVVAQVAFATQVVPVVPFVVPKEDPKDGCLRLLAEGDECSEATESKAAQLKKPSVVLLKVAKQGHDVCESCMSTVVWPDSANCSPSLKLCRRVTIKALSLCAQVKILSGVETTPTGLTRANTQLLMRLLTQAQSCLADFCKDPANFMRTTGKIIEPLCERGATLAQSATSGEVLHQENAKAVSHAMISMAFDRVLNARIMTRAILALFSSGALSIESTDLSQAKARLLAKHPEFCAQLGERVLACVKILSDASMNFWRKWAVDGLASLRALDGKIGAAVLAAFEDILISEQSAAMPLAERVVANFAQNDDRTPEQLQVALLDLFSTKLPLLVRGGVIVANTCAQLAPLLVKLVWDDSRPLAQLACFYLPRAFVAEKPAVLETSNEEALRMSSRVGDLTARIASVYLWREQRGESDLRAMFLTSIKAGVEQIVYNLMTSPNKSDPNFNAWQSARILNVIHLWLKDMKEVKDKKGTFQAKTLRGLSKLEEDKVANAKAIKDLIDKPFVDLVSLIVKEKAPYAQSLCGELTDCAREIADTFLSTVIGPRTIVNLIKAIRFRKEAEVEAQATPGKPPKPEPQKPVALDSNAHGHFGKAVLRVVRSIVDFAGQLTASHSSIIGMVNWVHARLGKSILQSPTVDYIAVLETILFPAEEKPWTDSPEQLRQELEAWIKSELIPHVQRLVKENAPRAASLFLDIEALVLSLVNNFQEIVLEEDQRSLRILLYHYLLPLFKNDIMVALSPSKR